MIRILFVCHGNICRSPMAECIMNRLCRERGADISCDSAATSREEIGNDIYPAAKRTLSAHGVPYFPRRARQVSRGDYEKYDLILCMERFNLRNLSRIIPSDPEHKIRLLSDFTSAPGRDISDPWYSGEFEKAYAEILEGCEGLYRLLTK